MTGDLWRLDATAQAELVRQGAVSSRELVQLALDRIEAIDPLLGATLGLNPERALELATRPRPGPFTGVPCLIKDVLPYPGLPCFFGSRLFEGIGFVPPAHVPYTAAIEASGLIPLGKSTTSEFGLLGSTESRQSGTTHNPWSSMHSAGGSSGGSAAAVAAGLVPIAHANDGGGSIRIPAAIQGLFGFKPSRDRAVLATATPSDFTALTIDHCVSRSVRDSARWLATTERRGSEAVHPEIGLVTEPLNRPLRIGRLTTSLMGHPLPATGEAAVNVASELCRELGHEVIEAPPPVTGPDVSEAFFTIAGAAVDQIEQTMRGMLGRPVAEDELEPFTWALLRWFRTLPSHALEQAHARLRSAASSYADFQARWDVTLSPTIGTATPVLGFLAPDLPREELIRRTERFAGYTPVHNMTGAPGMSVPLHEVDGLPVGCHFAGPPGEDRLLLQLAYQLEAATPWRDRWPRLASG